MTLIQYMIIIILKIFAIITVLAGILIETRNGAPWGYIAIAFGSLVFAIASNTTLFIVLLRRRGPDNKEFRNE